MSSITASSFSSKRANALRIQSELARAREARLLAELEEAEHYENRSSTSRHADRSDLGELLDRLGMAGLNADEVPSGSGIHHLPQQPEQCSQLDSPAAIPFKAHAPLHDEHQHAAIHNHDFTKPQNSISRNDITPLFSAPVATSGPDEPLRFGRTTNLASSFRNWLFDSPAPRVKQTTLFEELIQQSTKSRSANAVDFRDASHWSPASSRPASLPPEPCQTRGTPSQTLRVLPGTTLPESTNSVASASGLSNLDRRARNDAEPSFLPGPDYSPSCPSGNTETNYQTAAACHFGAAPTLSTKFFAGCRCIRAPTSNAMPANHPGRH